MKKITSFLRTLLNYLNLASGIELRMTGYLVEKGWYKSYRSKKSIDKDNKSIPWLTYPFITFLEKRLNKDLDVFEYGSGDSTFWYAQRVKSVDAVEHHYQWYQYVNSKKTDNTRIYHIALDYSGRYCKAIEMTQKKYDVVIVDGRDRNKCLEEALKALKPGGVVILDNSERGKYKTGILFMKEQGFKHLEFEGMSPVATTLNVTSLFYKSENCLGV
ncbi:MAG: FkbM family methyltransferase [Cytophagaceae bacterium]|jgi:hypothetical protein|nr:FkbM family methyltransferase [Cytophagaceae bacterium]